jgi:hypothetical protein
MFYAILLIVNINTTNFHHQELHDFLPNSSRDTNNFLKKFIEIPIKKFKICGGLQSEMQTREVNFRGSVRFN